jgi:hypothetical protein
MGLVVFGMQYLTTGRQVHENLAWTLGLIAFCAALSQYYATHTFRSMLTDAAPRLSRMGVAHLIKQANQNRYNLDMTSEEKHEAGILTEDAASIRSSRSALRKSCCKFLGPSEGEAARSNPRKSDRHRRVVLNLAE